MRDLVVTMAGPSTSHALKELEQIQVLNEVLDEIICEYSSDDDSVFDNDYTQLVTPGTSVISDRVIMVVTKDRKKSYTYDWERCPVSLCGEI
jgi:hypothetical protein